MQVVGDDLSRTPGLLGIKDPRIAHWFLSGGGSCEHWSAVAASLERRDGLKDSWDDLKCVVDFDRWFTHPREQAAVGGGDDPQADAPRLDLAVGRVDPSVRHHQPALKDRLSLVEETYEALRAATEIGVVAPELLAFYGQLSTVRAVLQAWSEVIAASPPDTGGVADSAVSASVRGRLRRVARQVR